MKDSSCGFLEVVARNMVCCCIYINRKLYGARVYLHIQPKAIYHTCDLKKKKK